MNRAMTCLLYTSIQHAVEIIARSLVKAAVMNIEGMIVNHIHDYTKTDVYKRQYQCSSVRHPSALKPLQEKSLHM